MLKQLTSFAAECARDATVGALSRRALLASPMAFAACPPAIAAPTGASDELKWMVDTYEEIRAELTPIEVRMNELWEDPTRPEFVDVTLREAAANIRDYGVTFTNVTFRAAADIQDFFHGYARAQRPLWGAGSPRFRALELDRQSALWIYEERRAAVEAWGVDSGMRALDERADELHGKLGEIENWLRAYTCRSLADVIAIAAFAETWLADNGTDMEARSDLLRAISAFAVATEAR